MGTENTREQTPQEEEAASFHVDWRCSHTHWGPGETRLQRGPATVPHRHVPFQQTTLDLEGDLLGFDPVRWTVEWAGPERRCRGIEVVSLVQVGRWVADPGHPAGGPEPAAARVRPGV